jgi:hypothetical protein
MSDMCTGIPSVFRIEGKLAEIFAILLVDLQAIINGGSMGVPGTHEPKVRVDSFLQYIYSLVAIIEVK